MAKTIKSLPALTDFFKVERTRIYLDVLSLGNIDHENTADPEESLNRVIRGLVSPTIIKIRFSLHPNIS